MRPLPRGPAPRHGHGRKVGRPSPTSSRTVVLRNVIQRDKRRMSPPQGHAVGFRRTAMTLLRRSAGPAAVCVSRGPPGRTGNSTTQIVVGAKGPDRGVAGRICARRRAIRSGFVVSQTRRPAITLDARGVSPRTGQTTSTVYPPCTQCTRRPCRGRRVISASRCILLSSANPPLEGCPQTPDAHRPAPSTTNAPRPGSTARATLARSSASPSRTLRNCVPDSPGC